MQCSLNLINHESGSWLRSFDIPIDIDNSGRCTKHLTNLLSEGEPRALIHEDDAARLGLGEGAMVRLGNARGEVKLAARAARTARPGVVIVEGNWPSDAYPERVGINTLIGADPVPPNGGAAFHDTAVWMRAA